MPFKGALWAVSLFKFSLAAYLAVPFHNPSRNIMSAASISRAVTKKVLAIETPEGQGAMGTLSRTDIGCDLLTFIQFAEVSDPPDVRGVVMLWLRTSTESILL